MSHRIDRASVLGGGAAAVAAVVVLSACAKGTPTDDRASSTAGSTAGSASGSATASGAVPAGATPTAGTTAPGALVVTQPAAHATGRTWTHYGPLTVTGRVRPAPAAGTTVTVQRNGQQVGTATTDAAGAFTATVSNTSEVGSFTYVARAGSAATDSVVVQNRTPTVTLGVPAQVDAVKTAQVSVRVQPVVATATTVQVDDSGWTSAATATTSASGAATTSVTTGLGTLSSYRLRGSVTAPDGTTLTGIPVTMTRVARLDAVVRPTTAADVRYTWHAGCPVGPSQLSTITMNYLGFDHRVHTGGVMIVDKTLVQTVVAGFRAGMAAGFPIRQMVNPNHWHGDDDAMMAADNTSGFNCRAVAGQTSWSHHAYGRAVDVNTVENPYIESDGTVHGNRAYTTNRPAGVQGMLYPDSAITRSFVASGATWLHGTDWQHFQW